ncbi:MAG: translocation/assembly module TamB domain-containing protein [Advenella sp.]|uniref:translocation/assembly module TamB domain-containing protein n=1 Tax=Advenella sp. TaxID=1872388 RepID=UPI003F982565
MKMKYLRWYLRWKPIVLTILIGLCAFVFWFMGTNPGSRWLLNTVISQVGGELHNVRGTLWSGIELERLLIDTPEIKITGRQAVLKVDWLKLFKRTLRVQQMSVADLDVKLLPLETTEPAPDEAKPFEMPGIPVGIQVDRLDVGDFALLMPDGSGLPVGLSNFSLTDLLIIDQHAKGTLKSVHVSHPQTEADLNGTLEVESIKSPYPMKLDLNAKLATQNKQSPVCLSQFVQIGSVLTGALQQRDCTFDLHTQVAGDLEKLGVAMQGSGQGAQVDASLNLGVMGGGIPLNQADVNIKLGDASGLQFKLEKKEKQGAAESDRIAGSFASQRLTLKGQQGTADSVLTTDMTFVADVLGLSNVQGLQLKGTVDSESRLQGKPLAADLDIDIDSQGVLTQRRIVDGEQMAQAVADNIKAAAARKAQQEGKTVTTATGEDALQKAQQTAANTDAIQAATTQVDLNRLNIRKADIDLQLGENSITTSGSFGQQESVLRLSVDAPKLGQLVDGVNGTAKLSGTLAGTIAEHALDISGKVNQGDAKTLGKAPADLSATINGKWHRLADGIDGWEGELATLNLVHAGVRVRQRDALPLLFSPNATGVQNVWAAGPGALGLTLPGGSEAQFKLDKASGNALGVTTAGSFVNLTISDRLMDEITRMTAAGDAQPANATAAASDKAAQATAAKALTQKTAGSFPDIVFDGDWKIATENGLQGTVNVRRTAGDRFVPLVQKIPLDFETLSINLNETRQDEKNSVLTIAAQGQGPRSSLDTKLNLAMANVIPLRDGKLQLALTDGAAVNADFETIAGVSEGTDRLTAKVGLQALNLQALSAGATPASLLNGTVTLVADTLPGKREIADVDLDTKLAQGSTWNGKPLAGTIGSKVHLAGIFDKQPEQEQVDRSIKPNLDKLQVSDTDVDLTLGNNRITAHGGFGQDASQLYLDVNAPALANFWPSLPGSALVNAVVDGRVTNHRAQLYGMYAQAPSSALGKAPVVFGLNIQGAWNKVEGGQEGWVGVLQDLNLRHTELRLQQQSPMSLSFLPDDGQHPMQWATTASRFLLDLPENRSAQILPGESGGNGSQWQTKGQIKDLVINPQYLMTLQKAFVAEDPAAARAATQAATKALAQATASNKKAESAARDGGKRAAANTVADKDITLDADWDLAFNQMLTGSAHIMRTDGTGVLPFKTPVPLDFDTIAFDIEPQQTPQVQDGYVVTASATGEKSHLNADVKLDMATPLLLRDAKADLALRDGATMTLEALVSPKGGQDESDRIHVRVNSKALPVSKLMADSIPRTLLSTDLTADVDMFSPTAIKSATIKGRFDKGSIWNDKPLAGSVDLAVRDLAVGGQGSAGIDLNAFQVPAANIDLTLGSNKIRSKGAFGQADSVLTLDVDAPALSSFWPGLPGSVTVDGTVKGMVAKHALDLKGMFSQGKSRELGKAPVNFHVAADGTWDKNEQGVQGWRGTLSTLDVQHAGISVEQDKPWSLAFAPAAEGGLPAWEAGPSAINIGLPGKHSIVINQEGTTGSNGKWQTKGSIRRFVLSPAFIRDMQKLVDPAAKEAQNANTGIIDRRKRAPQETSLVLDFDWDLAFDGALTGKTALKRVSGDFMIPAATPIPLGLTNMLVGANFNKTGATTSAANLNLAFDTQNKGNLKGTGAIAFNGLTPNLNGGSKMTLNGNLADISWMGPLTGDMLDLGGAVALNVTAQSRANGQWTTSGKISGSKVKIVEIDNGIRLLDGTLEATLRDNQVVINTLRFPSVIRIKANEWRTKKWIEDNPPAQNGSLGITGKWNLNTSKGDFRIVFDHYPIIQRSDRFVMISGDVDINAPLPKVDIKGKVTADAGWASVDILGSVPAVDGDVIVLKPGQTKVVKEESPLDLTLDFTVDLGKRFYIVGLGLDSGLVGSLNVIQEKNQLTGVGAFRTRGGAIEAYGQRLQIRRGRITFQGNLANPILDIEALRTGLDVEAGVKVVGTARKPKIDLVSYPDVSEVEKLSWLLMGRGPDSSGSDAALLFSVGSSIVGGGEPFYRKMGLDDIAIRSGNVGKSGTVLPEKTVASSVNQESSSDLSQQFFVASKKFENGMTVSVEQAMAGTGTVVRGSYRLFRNLSADIKGGTVNGLELIYRRFFRD